jgi:alpha,alpha-trehalose phosphorylase
VAGLAGMRERQGTLAFAPRLPPGIDRLAIGLLVQHRRLRVEVTPETTTYQLVAGDPLQIFHDGEPASVPKDSPLIRPTRKVPVSGPPAQPRGREPRRRQAAERRASEIDHGDKGPLPPLLPGALANSTLSRQIGDEAD